MRRVITAEKFRQILLESQREYEDHIRKTWALPLFRKHGIQGVRRVKKLLKPDPIFQYLDCKEDKLFSIISHLHHGEGNTRSYSFKTILLRNLHHALQGNEITLKRISNSYNLYLRYITDDLLESFKSRAWQKDIYGVELEDSGFMPDTLHDIKTLSIKAIGLNPNKVDRYTIVYRMMGLKNKIKHACKANNKNVSSMFCWRIIKDIDSFFKLPNPETWKRKTLLNPHNPGLNRSILKAMTEHLPNLKLLNPYRPFNRVHL